MFICVWSSCVHAICMCICVWTLHALAVCICTCKCVYTCACVACIWFVCICTYSWVYMFMTCDLYILVHVCEVYMMCTHVSVYFLVGSCVYSVCIHLVYMCIWWVYVVYMCGMYICTYGEYTWYVCVCVLFYLILPQNWEPMYVYIKNTHWVSITSFYLILLEWIFFF